MNEPLSPTGHIRLVGITRQFEKAGVTIPVLRDIDVEIAPGDRIAITGASGVGKSTLLHILGTIDRPSKGNVYYDAQNVFALDAWSLASFRNRSVGFVFQFHHLLPGFTALENVMIPAIIGGHDMAKAKKWSAAALESVGLAHRLRHQPGELSGGEQQRVAIARAIVMKPRVLLADEPTGNLDTHTGEAIHELLSTLNATQGITLIVVTHNLELAQRLPRRFRLFDGHLMDESALASTERA